MIKNNILNNLTILVNTCDAYDDVLGIFFYAFKDYWPDCPCPVVINTESKNYSYSARVHHHTKQDGLDDWGARLLSSLSTIDTDYVLMLYDDFILDAPVSNKRVENALLFLQSDPHSAVIYLVDTSLPLSVTDSDDDFIKLKDRVNYRLNSAPAIWNKNVLINYTEKGDTPWAWEVFGTYRTWGDLKNFYAINPKHTSVYAYDHRKGGAIYRGKWVKEVVELAAKKYPVHIDWSIRGFSSNNVLEKRSLRWKINFILTGYKMVGFRFLYFLSHYLRVKFYGH